MPKRNAVIVVRQAGSAAGLIPVADELTADELTSDELTADELTSDALAARSSGWHFHIIAFPMALATCREVANDLVHYPIHAADSEQDAQSQFIQLIDDAAFILTGTSSEAQADAWYWRTAREHGVESIAYLDQWSNIEKRFPGSSRNDWPDNLAVIDAYDQKLARTIAPEGVQIHITGSPALDNIVRQVNLLRAQGIQPDPQRIVFATEPVESPEIYREINGFTDQDSFALAVKLIRTHHPGSHLVLRLHLRDTPERWQNLLPADIPVEWDTKTRAETLAASGIVFGMRSFFLVEAAVAGVKVLSLQPGKKTYCPLTDERMKVIVKEQDYP